MNTFWLLVRHEWALLRADSVVRLTVLVFLVSLSGAMAAGAARAAREEADVSLLHARASSQRTALAREAAEPLTLSNPDALPWGSRHPDYVANERGAYAVLPPAPLLALTVGQSDLYANHYKVTARLQQAQLAGDQLTHPLAQLTGHFDLTFVVLYLYPLMILASGFDLTVTERQSGTLRMLLAFPVPLSVAVLAKVMARAALLLMLPAALLLSSLASGGASYPVGRLLLWTLAVLVYGGFWLGLSIIVGATARSASASALVLAGAWLILVVLVPSLLNLLIRSAVPVPSSVEFATRARAATRDAVLQGSRQLGSFLEDHPASGTGLQGMQQYAMLQDIRDTEVNRRMQPVLAQHEGQLARQRRAVSGVQFLSPIMVMQLALTDIAGTGDVRYARFRNAVSEFQGSWKTFFQPRILTLTPLSSHDIASAPTFAFGEEPLPAVVGRVAVPLLALLAVTMLLWWWGFRIYASYDVTA